ncbi:hypothetical protein BJ742DRAFT_737970 [Cladochytrium replicatum]|nr:hypothetical protein BJ742DRAFT_737970 [Cladochytrium replicatum]
MFSGLPSCVPNGVPFPKDQVLFRRSMNTRDKDGLDFKFSIVIRSRMFIPGMVQFVAIRGKVRSQFRYVENWEVVGQFKAAEEDFTKEDLGDVSSGIGRFDWHEVNCLFKAIHNGHDGIITTGVDQMSDEEQGGDKADQKSDDISWESMTEQTVANHLLHESAEQREASELSWKDIIRAKRFQGMSDGLHFGVMVTTLQVELGEDDTIYEMVHKLAHVRNGSAIASGGVSSLHVARGISTSKSWFEVLELKQNMVGREQCDPKRKEERGCERSKKRQDRWSSRGTAGEHTAGGGNQSVTHCCRCDSGNYNNHRTVLDEEDLEAKGTLRKALTRN